MAPIGNPQMKIRSVSLAKEDPGDLYLGDIPVVDEFGQYNLGEWEGKIHSLDQLREQWAAEDSQAVNRAQYKYSGFGGYQDARIDEGTGFFRTEKIDGPLVVCRSRRLSFSLPRGELCGTRRWRWRLQTRRAAESI